MLRLLLENGGQRAKEIKAAYRPMFPDKDAYLAYLNALDHSGDRIRYRPDGSAEVDLM